MGNDLRQFFGEDRRMSRNFLVHLHPGKVSSAALRPSATWGLGIACLTCLGILVATGITLFLNYVPDQARAYERILHITTTLRFGRLVRNLHFLAANALVVLSILHLVRVVLTGSYKGRWLNWLYGLGLLVLVLAASFTGYLLPWDQVSYWAIRVGSSLAEYIPFAGPALRGFLLGGNDIGSETLLRSFAFHAAVLPLLLIGGTGLHLWRIRKDGGLAISNQWQFPSHETNPWLFRAEGGVAFLVLAFLLCLSLIWDAPIYERANPLHPPNPAKAPWYFVGIQEMISHSAFWGGIFAPLAITVLLICLPTIDRSRSAGGRWLAADRWPCWSLFLLILLSQIGFIIVGQWLRGPDWQLVLPF